GLIVPVQMSLEKAGLKVSVFDRVAGNPTDADAAAATKAFVDARADLVVALGGGSPLDIGKLVRLCATHEGPLAEYDDARGGSQKVKGPLPPMIGLPTTAGT